MKHLTRILLSAAFSLVAASASAQTFPSHTVRIIVPFPAGGSMDAVGRILGRHLAELWKQPVVVENRPGSASVIGTRAVAEAAPDGHTIGMIANGFTANPALYSKLPFDTVKDFTPVTQVTFTPNVLVANPKVPFRDMREFVHVAKSQPGKFSSGSIGNGTAAHLALERLKGAAGIDILHVPYQGLAPGVTAVLAGHTDLMVANLPDVLPHIKSGKLIGLAVGSAKRHQLAPEIPTLVESGFPNFVSGAWYGMVVPSGTPAAIVQKLHGDLVKVLNVPEVRAQIQKLGFDAVGSSPAEFESLIKAEMESNATLIRRIGIKLD
jgi:tripartite-type tricarboxylate transporter receptor subunit TctC